MFKVIFRRLLHGKQLLFIEPSHMSTFPDDMEMLILGGGDVVNKYFIDPLVDAIDKWINVHKYRVPSYVISVGVTCIEQIIQGVPHPLDHFDYFILRNKRDCDVLVSRYGDEYVKYLPDIVHLYPHYFDICPKRDFKIGLFLSGHVYMSGKNPLYDDFVNKMINIVKVIKEQYKVEFVSLSTEKNDINNDHHLNMDILTRVGFFNTSITCTNDPLEICDLFSTFAFTICMKYHAHVMSNITHTPFISLCMTDKVEQFTKDNGYVDNVIMLSKNNGITIGNVDEVLEKIECLTYMGCSRECKREQMNDTYDRDIHNNYDNHNTHDVYYNHTTNNITADVIPSDYLYPIKNNIIRSSPPSYFNQSEIEHVKHKIVEELFYAIRNYCGLSLCFDKTLYNIETIPQLFKTITGDDIDLNDIKLKNILSHVYDFNISEKLNSDYFWGIQNQIYDLNMNNSIKWILEHKYYNKKKILISSPSLSPGILPGILPSMTKSPHFLSPLSTGTRHGKYLHPLILPSTKLKLNMNYIESNMCSDCHRSGWSYVTDALYSKFHCDNANVILDTFVDATFHWNYDFLKNQNLIPYTQPWVGIIHHTSNISYTDYNTVNLMNNNDFIVSLQCCKCLVLLSTKLKEWFDEEFKRRNVCVKTLYIPHPTDMNVEKFTMDNFYNNPERRVVQIGGWLRNSFAIYTLHLNGSFKIKKVYLKGKNMDNYVKPSDFNIEGLVYNYECVKNNINMPSSSTQRNKFIQGLIDYFGDMYKSVEIIDTLTNDEYDELLSKNIVFLNLVDASACNTVIECIVRNTPIIVNRLPAIVEMLGKEYPLFYDTLIEAENMITNINCIIDAYEYLYKKNKHKFTINYFLEEMEKNIRVDQ